MNKKKILIYIYKILSIFYTFIFGRKKLQSVNHLFFSLTLDAKGFKNYGSFKKTGEEYLIKLIKDEVQPHHVSTHPPNNSPLKPLFRNLM